MRRSRQLSAVLERGGFSLHGLIGRLLGVGFVAQNLIIASAAVVAVVVASRIDGSWLLPGRNVGLFQHPAIWAFFGLQVALPLSLRHSLAQLLKARTDLQAVGALDGSPSAKVVNPLIRYLKLEDAGSKAVATVVYSFGLAAFVWNTYQNQLPGIVLPFDFWDSSTFVAGFWVTRVYKFYLFVWLLPYVALLHVAILVTALRQIHASRICGTLHLLPFHSDGVGGLGFLPDLVTRPLMVAALWGTIPTAGAFLVHRAADVTPIMGLGILAVGAVVAYFVPIMALRSDIVATKHAMIRRLRQMQQSSFTRIFDSENPNLAMLKEGDETIECTEHLCASIQRVSNYPHLRRLVGVATLAMTPAFGSLLGKLIEDFGPVVLPWLAKP